MILIGLFVLGFVLISQGVSTGAGGPDPDQVCKNAVDSAEITNDSPLIQCSFIAAYEHSEGPDQDNLIVKIHLDCERPYFTENETKKKEIIIRRLFDFEKPDNLEKLLCAYSAEHIKTDYKYAPCMWEIGKAFDLVGIPVISGLTVMERTNCQSSPAMSWISGNLKIRVVSNIQE